MVAHIVVPELGKWMHENLWVLLACQYYLFSDFQASEGHCFWKQDGQYFRYDIHVVLCLLHAITRMYIKAIQLATFSTHTGKYCSVLWRSHGMAVIVLPWSLWINLFWMEHLRLTVILKRKTRTLLCLAHSLNSIVTLQILRPPVKSPLNFAFSVALTWSKSTEIFVGPKITHSLTVSPQSHHLQLTLPAVVSCLCSSWVTLKYSNLTLLTLSFLRSPN